MNKTPSNPLSILAAIAAVGAAIKYGQTGNLGYQQSSVAYLAKAAR